MDIEQKATELTELRVVRRGLLAGLAGMVAAVMLKLTGAGEAEAASVNIVTENITQSTASEIRLSSGAGYPGAVLQVLNGGTADTGLRGAIYGQSSGNAATGIYGHNASLGGTGVRGLSESGSGVLGETVGGTGVLATSFDTSAFALRAVSNHSGTALKAVSNASNLTNDGDGAGVAVLGKSGSGFGVRGESTGAAGVSGFSVNQPGVDGTSTNSLGVRGTSTNFVGIVGISTNSHGLYGSTHVGANGFGIVAENFGGSGPGMLVTGGAPSQFYGGLQVFGPKNAVLKMQDGTFASVYCQESPEPYFEDFGRAQLVGGVANVPLEREFATLVAGGDYMVFPVAEGETRGLFVSRRTPGGFEVREMQGGVGNVPFTYRIVTRRKDIEGKRFARVSTEAAEKVAGVRAVLAGMGAAGPTSGPSSPLPSQQAVPPIFTNTPPVIPGGTTYTNLPPGVGPSSVNPNIGR